MSEDPHITKDGYHIEDIIVNGRCLWCGRLGQEEYSTVYHKFCSRVCRYFYQAIKDGLIKKGFE